jgi:hypothetical protein
MAYAFDIVTSTGGKKYDRAYIGWIDGVWGDQTAAEWTDAFWGRLFARDTVGQAKWYADTYFQRVHGSAEIEGDKNTTLHAVYGGTLG